MMCVWRCNARTCTFYVLRLNAQRRQSNAIKLSLRLNIVGTHTHIKPHTLTHTYQTRHNSIVRLVRRSLVVSFRISLKSVWLLGHTLSPGKNLPILTLMNRGFYAKPSRSSRSVYRIPIIVVVVVDIAIDETRRKRMPIYGLHRLIGAKPTRSIDSLALALHFIDQNNINKIVINKFGQKKHTLAHTHT